ncbi:hypothetical protein H2248_006690 [Termitomyces sp. 'cryptogamus']|nr:hypothetical protein H2248_006690 [Termitomyces sp. 'cryptogamus']
MPNEPVNVFPPPYPYTLVATMPIPCFNPMHTPVADPLRIPTPIVSPAPGSPHSQNPLRHYAFGPTPISTQHLTSYAYHDPRSPYSIEQAGIRARQRFFEALFWAVATWCLIGFMIGSSAAHIVYSFQ